MTEKVLARLPLKLNCAGNSDGLVVATVVLAIVSFVAIAAIVLYYFNFYQPRATAAPESVKVPAPTTHANVVYGQNGQPQHHPMDRMA